MSNQEAIVLLRNLEDALDSYCELNEEGKTAFRMAIEALQGKDINVSSKDTISRQAAIAHAISGRTRELEGEKWIRASEVRESLQTMPSAQPEITEDDVKEFCRKRCLIVVTSDFYDEMIRRWASAERRGRWEEVQRLSPAEHQAICECSVCGNTVWAYIGERRWHYCPNCGSRMDLDEVTE